MPRVCRTWGLLTIAGFMLLAGCATTQPAAQAHDPQLKEAVEVLLKKALELEGRVRFLESKAPEAEIRQLRSDIAELRQDLQRTDETLARVSEQLGRRGRGSRSVRPRSQR